MKKLKLEIVNLDNNDVIATSGSLCSFDLTGYYNTFTYSTY